MRVYQMLAVLFPYLMGYKEISYIFAMYQIKHLLSEKLLLEE